MTGENDRRQPTDWFTLITNVGVILGLVLLAYEIREANKLSESQAYFARLDQMQQAAVSFSESDVLPDVYIKIGATFWTGSDYASDIRHLTEEEQARLYSWERGVMLRMSGHYHQYVQGYLEESTAEQVLGGARDRQPLWEALGIRIEGQDLRNALERD